ncbi:MAG: ATP synthase F1 subunit epsilon [Prevotella sp.]
MGLILRIVSPERVEYSGNVESVTVPGTLGEFQVLVNHAPLISSLERGVVKYSDTDGKHELVISGGFIEVQKNNVSLCVEL